MLTASAAAIATAVAYNSYLQAKAEAGSRPTNQRRDPLADMARAERLASEVMRVQRSALYGTALLLALVASAIWVAIDILRLL